VLLSLSLHAQMGLRIVVVVLHLTLTLVQGLSEFHLSVYAHVCTHAFYACVLYSGYLSHERNVTMTTCGTDNHDFNVHADFVSFSKLGGPKWEIVHPSGNIAEVTSSTVEGSHPWWIQVEKGENLRGRLKRL